MKLFATIFALASAQECSDGIHGHHFECATYFQCSAGHQFPDQVKGLFQT